MALQTRGIFSLREIYRNDRKGIGYPVSDVWIPREPAPPNCGYVAGGGVDPGNSPSQIVDKIVFSTETTARVPSANLSTGRGGLSSVASETSAYFAGGWPISSVDKLDYSTDITARMPSMDMSSSRYLSSSTFNNTAGYISGGQPGNVSSTDKLTYATSTSGYLPGADTPASFHAFYSGSANSPSAGYVSGGGVTSPTSDSSSTIKFTFASEGYADLPSSSELYIARNGICGYSSPSSAYFTGGFSQSSTDKLSFSDDSMQRVPGANSPSAESGSLRSASATSKSTDGYISGGNPSKSSTIVKLQFSDETFYSVSSVLSAGRYQSASISGAEPNLPGSPISFPTQQFKTYIPVAGPNAGYAVGGRQPGAPTNPGSMSIVDKIDYATDTSSAVGNTPNPSDNNGITNSSTDLYSAGGYPTQVGAVSSIIYKVTYASDTAGTAPNLTEARYGTGGLSSPSNGYYSGGGPGVSITDRLVFSSDSISRIPSADVPHNGTYRGGMAGNTSKGYFMMGASAPGENYRLDYSTESYTTLPLGIFPTPGNSSVATGNPESAVLSTNAIYFQRLIYSTETGQLIPSAPKPELNMQLHAASSNSDGAYFSGGYYPSITEGKSDTIKLSYGSDTVSNIPAANLSAARYSLSGGGARSSGTPQPPAVTPTAQTVLARSSTQLGYMSGGINPALGAGNIAYLSTIYKLNMADESVELVPGQNTSGTSGKTIHTSTGNSDAGYYSGGLHSSTRSVTDKNTYSIETVARVPTLDLPVAGYGQAGVSNTTNGFLMGASPNSSNVYKISFSDDSIALSSPAQMPRNSRYLQALGTTTAGYGMLGQDTSIPAYYSNGIKLTYSSETSASIPLADVPTYTYSILQGAVITGNSTTGYFQLPGNPVAAASQIVRFTYSNDTSSLAPSAELLQESYVSMGMGDGSTAGYILGGRINSTSPTTAATYVQKLTFSDETTSNIPATISQPNQRGSALSAADFGLPGSQAPTPVNC